MLYLVKHDGLGDEQVKSTVSENILHILLDNTNASIRYQTLTYFVPDAKKSELSHARSALENDTHVRQKLETADKVVANFSFNHVHGATNGQLENILPMLLDRGLDRTFPAFDDVFSKVPSILQARDYCGVDDYHVFADIVLVPFLLVAGYRDTSTVSFYKRRLSLTSEFCGHMDFDIFGDQSGYKSIPKTFRDRKVIRPELYENGEYLYPLIYDLYAHAAMYPSLDDVEQAQVNSVINYILSEQYQHFPFGYGILIEPDRRYRYHAMGWDCVLPHMSDELTAPILHRMELLAAFPIARQSKWFQAGLNLLGSYRNDNGMYLLPKAALQEKEACWLLGNHMGLDENRRKKDWQLIEGMFRTYRLIYRLEGLSE